MDKQIYYDAGELLSHKEFYKLCVGTRGRGKTFKFKVLSIKKFLANKSQFVYTRRYKTEHKNINQFFSDVIKVNNERIEKGKKPFFPANTKFEVLGSWKNGSGTFLINGEVAGFWLTLSIASTYKSTPYPNVKMLVFDEFLIKKGTYHYLNDEVGDLEDLVETVFRNRDDPSIVGVIMLANKISWYNPYFISWKIPPFKTRFYTVPNDSIIVEQDSDEEFKKAKYSTRLGQHLMNTKYGKYSIENEALQENSPFIEALPATARPYFKLRYNGETYGIWLDLRENKMYLSKKFDPYLKLEYALTTSDHTINTYYIKYKKNTRLVDIISYYEQGRLFAENSYIDNVLQEILKLLI